jgi:hypothetical protein
VITETTPETRARAGTTTRRSLLTLAGALLGLAVIVSATSAVTFTNVHDAARDADERTAPTIMQLTVARVALVKADAAAIGSLESGAALLVGSGDEFQSQIAIAGQSLTRVAQTNMLGEEGNRSLQFIEGLLVTYAGLVGEAAAHFGEEGRPASAAALWHASVLLHQKGGKDKGILASIDDLIDLHRDVLRDEGAVNAMTPGGVIALFAPAVALFVALFAAQVFWRRRFRRRVNLWLAGATAVVVALVALSCLVFVSGSRLDTAQGELRTLIGDADDRTSAIDAGAQRRLVTILDTACGNASCSETVEQFHSDVARADATEERTSDALLTENMRQVGEQTRAASENAGLTTVIVVLGVFLVATILLGFRPRLNEYRYRPR